jgi:hypothetical protein
MGTSSGDEDNTPTTQSPKVAILSTRIGSKGDVRGVRTESMASVRLSRARTRKYYLSKYGDITKQVIKEKDVSPNACRDDRDGSAHVEVICINFALIRSSYSS